MAEIKVDDFTLTSTWTCRTVYSYASTGGFLSATNNITGPFYGERVVQFAVPEGAKIARAKVHALHTAGSYGGKFTIGGLTPDGDGFVTLDSLDASNGYVEIPFRWTSYTDGSSAHTGSYPTYNGTSSQSKTTSHDSTTTVSEVYLLIEAGGGVIYRAEGGKLVPYQLCRAEGGKLVPYRLCRAEGGKLVPY